MSTTSMILHDIATTSPSLENMTVFYNTTNLMNATTEVPEMEDHIYQKVARGINIYATTLIVFGGCILNMIALAVLNKNGIAKSAVTVYLSTLACSDSIVLIGDWLNNWFRAAFDIYLIGHSDFVCRLYRYLFSASYMYSSWIVVALAFERFFVINFPFLAKRVSSVKKSIGTVLILLIVDLGVMSYQIFVNKENEGFCDWHPDFIEFHMTMNGWIIGLLYSYIPFFLILFFSLGMVVKLTQAARKRNKMTNTQENKDVQRITLTVVVICIIYLLLTTPLALFYFVLYNLGMWVEPTPSFELGESIIVNIALLNHACNFFLYVMTSGIFRKDLALLFGCCAKHAKKSPGVKYIGDQSASKDTRVTGLSSASSKSDVSADVSSDQKV